MRQGSSVVGAGAQPRRGPESVEETILDLVVRSEEDLPQVHRRSRQVSSLLGFDTSEQTKIGTAAAEVVGVALVAAGPAQLEFSLRTGFPDALYVSVRCGRPVALDPEQRAQNERTIRLASHLVDDAQLKTFGEVTAFVLRRSLPAALQPLTKARIREIRDHLASSVPRTLIEELREQNRELRRVQRDLVLSEFSLRQRIRQNALVAEVAAELWGKEPLAKELKLKLQPKLKRCAQEIVDELGVDCALIWAVEAGATNLVASAGLAQEDRPSPEIGDWLLAAFRERGTRYASRSISDEPPSRHRDWTNEHQLLAFAAYPIQGEDTALGLLSVYAQAPIAPEALDTLAVVASQIAMAMERLQRLEERERLLASEHQARLKAERATKMRDHLLAIVAHDLRNPLSAIVTASALLKRVPLMGEELRWRKHLQTISNSVERMNRLILDLLDVASIEAGCLRFTLSRHPVSSLMGELAEHYLPIAEARGLRLDVHDESGAEIAADRGRLLQAMFNLLDNAFKFSPPEGTVSVRALRRGSDVVIGITDRGTGISESDQARVFEPYWQAEPRARSGLGLGLSIVKGVVEAHGGRVWFERAEGGGTTFFLNVPALADSATDEARRVR